MQEPRLVSHISLPGTDQTSGGFARATEQKHVLFLGASLVDFIFKLAFPMKGTSVPMDMVWVFYRVSVCSGWNSFLSFLRHLDAE